MFCSQCMQHLNWFIYCFQIPAFLACTTRAIFALIHCTRTHTFSTEMSNITAPLNGINNCNNASEQKNWSKLNLCLVGLTLWEDVLQLLKRLPLDLLQSSKVRRGQMIQAMSQQQSKIDGLSNGLWLYCCFLNQNGQQWFTPKETKYFKTIKQLLLIMQAKLHGNCCETAKTMWQVSIYFSQLKCLCI